MLILFGIVTPSMRPGTVLEVVNVRLKDAFLNHWYKKYLHILFDVKAPQQIVGRHSHLRLKPLPRDIDPQHALAIIGVSDVEAGTELNIPLAYQAGAFFQQNQTNLFWTNTFSNSSNPITPFTLLLANFYIESKLQTLFLQFTNRKIALKNNSIAIATAKDFDEASNNLEARLKAESLAIMLTKPLGLSTSSEFSSVTDQIDRTQEHYFGDNINVTSIHKAEETATQDNSYEETNEIDPFIRQRRSAEHLEEHSVTSAGMRHVGIFQTSVNMISSIFNQPGKQDVAQIANDSSQPKASSTEHINYEGTTLYGNAHLVKWIASFFVLDFVKGIQNKEQVLSQTEKTSEGDWAFKHLQDGIDKYNRG